jgi:hypothetical protein
MAARASNQKLGTPATLTKSGTTWKGVAAFGPAIDLILVLPTDFNIESMFLEDFSFFF